MKKRAAHSNVYRDPFLLLCRVDGWPAPKTEYRFSTTRQWRFDYAWPDRRVAVEIDGGVFIQGRHSRGVGMLRDIDKYNAAAVAGWLVLRTTPRTIHLLRPLLTAAFALRATA